VRSGIGLLILLKPAYFGRVWISGTKRPLARSVTSVDHDIGSPNG